MAPKCFFNYRPVKKYSGNVRVYQPSIPKRGRASSDYGIDNFSYDDAHMDKWTIPEKLLAGLPDELKKPATDWQYAGAAVCTALDRIQKLDEESLVRGYPGPETTSHPHMSRRVSNAQTSTGNDTPPMSSPESSAPASFASTASSMLPMEKMSFSGFPARQVVGLESPPFTPIDSDACTTPEQNLRGVAIPNSKMPDVNALTRQLSPISLRGRGCSTTSQSPTAEFDESAWDVYVGSFKAELTDIKSHALNRVKGLTGQIDRLSLEYSRDSKFKEAIEEFTVWWAEHKGQVGTWEVKVRELELPDIEYIRKERRSMGWTV